MIFTRKEKINSSFEHKMIRMSLGDKLCDLLASRNAFLAGGSVCSLFTRKDPNDWDIFFESEEDLKYIESIFESSLKYRNETDLKEIKYISKTQNAITYECPLIYNKAVYESYGKTYIKGEKLKIQLCSVNFLPLKELVNTFDWTCVMAGYDFKSQDFYFHPNFFPDNSRKELVFNTLCKKPLSAYFRKNKYLERGYTINFEEELKLLLHLKDKEYETIEDVILELRGVEHRSAVARLIKNFNKFDHSVSKFGEASIIKVTTKNILKLLESDFDEHLQDIEMEALDI